ncbi:hypothetical protein CMI47_12640 [Candidatus Pacearchaeota archaeon]|nr:hypothetical protein [Candidatus Pacearchaeota archaeon]|tara:strand:- start:5314 stop:5871 length:558 start_codon:yes stop_codon:yes gene_type:complete
MKGIILAGGSGSRLYPLTKVTNKCLLPVGNKPMIIHPLQTLLNAGITDIMVITSSDHAGHMIATLGSGSEYGGRFSFNTIKKSCPPSIIQTIFINNVMFKVAFIKDCLDIGDIYVVMRVWYHNSDAGRKFIKEAAKLAAQQFLDTHNAVEEKEHTAKLLISDTDIVNIQGKKIEVWIDIYEVKLR